MNQEPLPLQVLDDLTDWLEGPPPMIGWWDTRHSDQAPVFRRFYHGMTSIGPSWSPPVELSQPGTSMREFGAKWGCTSHLQYRGLRTPSKKALYPFPLNVQEFKPGEHLAAWDWEVVTTSSIQPLTSAQIQQRPARIKVAPSRLRVRVVPR